MYIIYTVMYITYIVMYIIYIYIVIYIVIYIYVRVYSMYLFTYTQYMCANEKIMALQLSISELLGFDLFQDLQQVPHAHRGTPRETGWPGLPAPDKSGAQA